MNYQESALVDQSIIHIVNQLISHAIEVQASDIHLEPEVTCLRVRLRIDGLLYDQTPIKKQHMLQVISRLKVLGNMDIAQMRLPQDGMLQFSYDNRMIDVRLSTFPALSGEKMVIRLLDRAIQSLAIDQLGFSPILLESCKSLVYKSAGLVLVTGPTGSGKTTTLYAALMHVLSSEKNIITLEDPVEYQINQITQGQINPGAGFTFEKGMRSILRQDPDIIMIGEIRDYQTAHTAIEAALTGHLVLSTLHTDDAPSAITRLMDMGIEPYLINAALNGVIAQRLVRKICTSCRIVCDPIAHAVDLAKKYACEDQEIFTGSGCSSCAYRGYKGRMGIFQILTMHDDIRSVITHSQDIHMLEKYARSHGMQTLVYDGREKILSGLSTLEELARVLP